MFEDWGRDLKKFDHKFKKDLDKTGRYINTKVVKFYNDILDGAEDNEIKRLKKHKIEKMGQIQAATAAANYMADQDRAMEVIKGGKQAASVAMDAASGKTT